MLSPEHCRSSVCLCGEVNTGEAAKRAFRPVLQILLFHVNCTGDPFSADSDFIEENVFPQPHYFLCILFF